MLELAKPALDVGLYTNELDAALAFWQDQAHVPFDELLPIGGGLHQHRHKIGQSILKVNNSRDPIPPGAPTGLRRLTIYSDLVDEALDLIDPDGNEVTLHPRAEDANLKLTLVAKLANPQDILDAVRVVVAASPTLVSLAVAMIMWRFPLGRKEQAALRAQIDGARREGAQESGSN